MKNLSVHLRAMEPEDLDLLYGIENDAELWDLGNTNVPYSRYVLHEFIANSTGDIYTDKQVRLIVENDEHEVVGLLDLVNFDPKHLRAEIGLVIERHQRRLGYAWAALNRLLDYARSTLHLHQLYVVIAVDNEPSLELFRKLGFVESGCLADWLYDGYRFSDAIVMQKVLGA